MKPLVQLKTLTQQCRLAQYSWGRTTLFVMGRLLFRIPFVGALLLAAVPRSWAQMLNCYVETSFATSAQTTELLPAHRIVLSESERQLLSLRQLKMGRAVDDFPEDYVVPGYRLIQLNDATLLAHAGGVCRQDGVLVLESAFDAARLERAKSLYRQPRPLRSVNAKYSFCTSVIHYPFNRLNIYHWWIDSLPRLYFLSRLAELGIDSLAILLPRESPKYQIESLQVLVDEIKNCVSLEFIGENEKWCCPRFILPTFVTGHQNGFLHREASEYIRDRMFRFYSITPTGGRRIYISRQRAKKMRVVNEQELTPVLKQFGVEVVSAEDLSYSDQIALFASADLVVGAHGAGLTNVLFCPPRAGLLELHPADQIRPHYMFLSKSRDMKYDYLLAGPQREGGFVVDPQFMHRKLEECLAGTA